MKNRLLSIGAMIALVSSGVTSSLDLNKAVSGVNTMKTKADNLKLSFDKAKEDLLKARIVMSDKRFSKGDQVAVAAQALVSGIDPLYQFIVAIEALNQAIIETEIPSISDFFTKQIAPQVKNVKNIADQIKKGTETIQSLLPKATVAQAAAITISKQDIQKEAVKEAIQ